ncbi:MAG TPA: alpha/beta hydrolase domain-containing protein [Gammaproteobacteria bacterium]
MTAPLDLSLGRLLVVSLALLLVPFAPAVGEVVGVTIASRSQVAGGRPFGASGAYEALKGHIELALDPADPHNRGIVDLEHAKRSADGRVHFTSDLDVLRPADPAKGNAVLLFRVANRGRGVGELIRRLSAPGASGDLNADSSSIDGLLMTDGYTLVSVGWEVDVPASLLRIEAPRAQLPPGADDRLSVELMYNTRETQGLLIDDPDGRPAIIYQPLELASATDVLTVRDRYWDRGQVVPRDRWRFVPNSPPKIELDGGFDPGRYYRVTYRATEPLIAGVGLAATRDAAAAFRYRSDLPIRGQSAYAFGTSQSGRFMRQFLYEGFNVDERDRPVFDAVWIHIAGAARGSFNERFAIEAHGDMFRPTMFPFSDAEQTDVDGARDGLLARYPANQRPKIFYTNTPVEYWGGGRAAALTHTTVEGSQDLELPDNVRMYFLTGTQHIPVAFPPLPRGERPAVAAGAQSRNDGQQLANPMPHVYALRALLRAWHEWTANGTPPPASRYPRLSDGTLVLARDVRFPALPGVANPRRIEGPARTIAGKVVPLPHLVPQVDSDGNEIAGIRYPEVAVPLATTTGWNFRDSSVGNAGIVYQTLGSYIPFPATKAARQASGDPRLSIEERYRGIDDYLERVRAAALELVQGRYLLEEDVDTTVARAREHWIYATSQPH